MLVWVFPSGSPAPDPPRAVPAQAGTRSPSPPWGCRFPRAAAPRPRARARGGSSKAAPGRPAKSRARPRRSRGTEDGLRPRWFRGGRRPAPAQPRSRSRRSPPPTPAARQLRGDPALQRFRRARAGGGNSRPPRPGPAIGRELRRELRVGGSATGRGGEREEGAVCAGPGRAARWAPARAEPRRHGYAGAGAPRGRRALGGSSLASGLCGTGRDEMSGWSGPRCAKGSAGSCCDQDC